MTKTHNLRLPELGGTARSGSPGQAEKWRASVRSNTNIARVWTVQKYFHESILLQNFQVISSKFLKFQGLPIFSDIWRFFIDFPGFPSFQKFIENSKNWRILKLPKLARNRTIQTLRFSYGPGPKHNPIIDNKKYIHSLKMHKLHEIEANVYIEELFIMNRLTFWT